jgi:hypothetical protein
VTTTSGSTPPAARPLDDQALALRLIATSCSSATCPTIYESDRGTLIIQGYTVSPASADVEVPDGERLVEIPMDLLAEAARRLA